MKTITFYSYKGGVGRSLTLSNIATRLADLGKRVCIIDFDLEAPGLHLKFKKYLNQKSINKGIVEYIYEFQEKSFIPEEISNYVVDISYQGTLNGSIKLMPAGNVSKNKYWKQLSSINWKELFYSKDNNGINLLLHLKEVIKKDLNPDFILIDSRTGITDISGIAMTLLSDKIVMLAANNEENISGTGTIIKSLLTDENNLTGKLPEIYFVLSRIPYYPNPEKKHIETRIINNAMESINSKEKLIDKVFVIHSDRELEALNYHLKYIEYNKDTSHAYNSIANTYRMLGDYPNAFKYIYKCLELEPKSRYGTGTLAEIYAAINNDDEFYKNLQLSFVFGMNSKEFQAIIDEEEIYERYFKEERFLNLLKIYRMKIVPPSSKKE